MSTQEALYDENQTLKNLVQSLQAENEELQRLVAQQEMLNEELLASLESATEQMKEIKEI